jgi:glucose dehydrogenase
MKRACIKSAGSALLLVAPATAAMVLLLSALGVGQATAARAPADADAARIANAEYDPANWLSYRRTCSEQRFSPLAQITVDNAGKLGLAWYADLDTNRGQEATPLVIDDVMYLLVRCGDVHRQGVAAP